MILLAILLWGMLSGWLANLILGGSSRPDDWGPLLVAVGTRLRIEARRNSTRSVSEIAS